MLLYLILFSNTDEPSRILRGTLSVLRCFFFFDLCMLLSGIGMILLAVTNNIDQKKNFIVSGGAMGFFASTSALVNCLASHGVKTWKRGFLLPWLGYYLTIFIFLVIFLANSVYKSQFRWIHIFLFVGTVLLYTCWRHMYSQFQLMASPRPQQFVVDVESLMRGILQSPARPNTTTTTTSDPKDLPPKYEELEEVPPPLYSSVVREETGREGYTQEREV